MAGDWIKMRTDLYRDPKVICIADALADPGSELAAYVNQNCQRDMTVTRNVMRNVTVGALVSVWGVMRHQGKRRGDDLFVSGVTLSVIDDIADLPGFGQALASVGWAVITDSGLIFPKFFEEHNADPIEAAKEKNRVRQARYRDRHSNVTDNVTSNVTVTHRVEKRRDKKETKAKKERPTVADVAVLCMERGYHFDPESFVAYYNANGWVQNRGKPIIDWKAACVTWEKNWLKDHGAPSDKIANAEDLASWSAAGT